MYSAPPPGYYGPPLMPLGTLFNEALNLFRRHSSLFMGLAAIQVLPGLFLAVALQVTGIGPRGIDQFEAIMLELQNRVESAAGDEQATTNLVQTLPWGLPTDALTTLLVWSAGIIFLQHFLFRTVALAATVAAVGDAYQKQAPTWQRALTTALRHMPTLLGWAVFSGIMVLGSIFLLLIPCLGVFIWLGLLILIAVRLLFVPQVIIAEQASLFQALSRSWDLTKGTFWRAFGAIFIFSFLVGLVAGLVTVIINTIFVGIFGLESGITLAGQQATGTIAGLLTTPLAYIGYTLLYYDYQLRGSTPAPAPSSYQQHPPYQ